jgi:hypothetical protein
MLPSPSKEEVIPLSTTSRIKVTLYLAILVAIVVILCSSGGTSEATASAPVQPQSAPHTPKCELGWSVVPSPNVLTAGSALNSVAVISENDVWGVGYFFSDTVRTLIEHWDGSTWSVIASPNSGVDNNNLYAVTAITSSDVWAVGTSGDETLVEHWDGSRWSVVASPGIGILNGVDALASNDIWAVGTALIGSETRTLVEHWDGSSWSIVPSPNVLSINGFSGVTAVSSNDVWAVGASYEFLEGGNSSHTLIEHWDGSAWSVVPSPDVGTLYGIDAIASNDIWAVGTALIDSESRTLVEHWDGSSWSVIPSPGSDALVEVAAIASNDVWAVGFSFGTLIEHWDGSAWNIVPSPSSNIMDSLNGVAAVSSNDVWAVGMSFVPESITLVERYNPIPCPPTPTPEPPRCASERFTDVCPTDYFYPHVLDLNDLDIVSGYITAPPCDGPTHIPCFKPYNWATRGQIAKVASLAAGFQEPVTTQFFEDVPPAHTFYEYIERMASRNIISGYPCGSESEPCIPPGNRPYFRPGNTISRGQLSKMAALAFGFNQPITTQTFEDVPPAYTFYEEIERLAVLNIISGYPCGSPEPCVPPDNRPYFRPSNNVTRGQIAKIVNLARIQPAPSVTPTLTGTATAVATDTPVPPTATITCCHGLTAELTTSCQGSSSRFSIMFNNTCPFTVTVSFPLNFDVAPDPDGPWTSPFHIDHFNVPIPPGISYYDGSLWNGPLPEGNKVWRASLHLVYYCEVMNELSDVLPACVTGTGTPTHTLTATATFTPTPNIPSATPTITLADGKGDV